MADLPAKQILKIVAHALKDLLPEVVFVGGITTALHMRDEEAPKPTATDDVDLVLEITTIKDYEDLETKLRKLGFKRNLSHPGPLCRFEYGEIVVDFMPVEPKILGFSNRWYKKGFESSIKEMIDEFEIRIFNLPYFLATKLEAFNDRGTKGALWESKDFEDIISVLDTRKDAIELIKSSPKDVREFINQALKKFLEDESRLREGIESVLNSYSPKIRPARTIELIKRIKQITA